MSTPPGKSKDSDSLLDFDLDDTAAPPQQIPAGASLDDLDFDLGGDAPAAANPAGSEETQPDFLATTIRPVGDIGPKPAAAAPNRTAAPPPAVALDQTLESPADDLLATLAPIQIARAPNSTAEDGASAGRPAKPASPPTGKTPGKSLLAWGLLGLFALLLLGVLVSLLLDSGEDAKPRDTVVAAPGAAAPSAPQAPASGSPLAEAIDSGTPSSSGEEAPPPAGDAQSLPPSPPLDSGGEIAGGTDPQALAPSTEPGTSAGETGIAPSSPSASPTTAPPKPASKSKPKPAPPPVEIAAPAPPPVQIPVASALIDRLRDTWAASRVNEAVPVKEDCTATVSRIWFMQVQGLTPDSSGISGTYQSGFESRAEGCGNFLGVGARRQAEVNGSFTAAPMSGGRLQFNFTPANCQGDCKQARSMGMVEGGNFVVERRGGDGLPDQLVMPTPEGRYEFQRYRP